jgi:Gram-negative bacterial TonB protein C-terminal
MSLFITLLLAILQVNTYVPPRLERHVSFDLPLNVVGTTWIVLNLRIDRRGRTTSVEKVAGEGPLLDLAVANARQWVFTPARNDAGVDSQVTAIYIFRPREFFSSPPAQFSDLRSSIHSVLPIEISDPGYPLNSVGEGATVIEFQVSESGRISGVRSVSDEPGLAEHTEQAARTWKFLPASRDGKAVAGTVVAVVSYFRPILQNPPPTVPPPPPTPTPPSGGVFRGDPPKK